MPIYETFSKRQKRLNGEMPDVYIYDDLPKEFRVQIVHIMRDCIGYQKEATAIFNNYIEKFYRKIDAKLSREFGIMQIGQAGDHRTNAITTFIQAEKNYFWVLDLIETILICGHEDVSKNNDYMANVKPKTTIDESIKELNARFKEHGLGYEFTDDMIIRIDNQHVHIEAIQPALELLHDSMYQGANHEFREAFDHYRKSEYKPAMVSAVKAFESTMKSICDKRSWAYDSHKDTASDLVRIILNNGLVPNYQANHFNSLNALLQSIATPRNKEAAHGDGTQVKKVPEYMVRFTLNMVASGIVMVVEAEKALC